MNPDQTVSQPAPPGSARRAPDSALPAKQERSRQLRDRLIASGRSLVETGGFTGTAMTDIARAAQCSVGALYFRFKDKEALFDSVVEVAMAEARDEARARVAAGRYNAGSLAATVARCIEDFVSFVQRNEGLIRALHQRTMEDPRRWGILRETAAAMVKDWVDAIARSEGRGNDRAFRRQVNVAFQFASGVLVHAILIQPPILSLDNPELGLTINAMMDRLIHFDGKTAMHAATKTQKAGGNKKLRKKT